MASGIKLYGTNWCSDCRRSRSVFERLKIDYEYINIEDNPEAVDYVIKVNHGNRSVPTIVFPDGNILVEPNDRVLSEQLGKFARID